MTDAPPTTSRPYADSVVVYAQAGWPAILPVPAREKFMAPQPVVLYRYLDAKGEMLYIGITSDPVRRWEQHTQTSEWVRFAAQSSFWVYPDRASARAAERSAILHDRPVFNSARPGSRQSGEARRRRYLRTGDGGGYHLVPCRAEDNAFCAACGPDADRRLDDVWSEYLALKGGVAC